MVMNRPENTQWVFGSFRLDASQLLLFRGGDLVPLSKKAAEILLVLVEQHGQLVEKEALMKRVWPDSFVEESNLAVHISQLRKTINDEDNPHRIETIPRRGYRFVGVVTLQSLARSGSSSSEAERVEGSTSSAVADVSAPVLPAIPAQSAKRSGRARVLLAVGIVVMAVVIAAVGRFVLSRTRGRQTATASRKTPAMKDSVVLAEIVNNTGDPVFDTTLRQALEVELEQSPYLVLVPEQRVQKVLRMMGKPPDASLTGDLASEVCQRIGGEAAVSGSIANLGSQYVLGLRAVNCRTGDHLSDLEITANAKEQVLKALGDISGQLRTKLGESLGTVQKFDTPIEEATTPSLEALQAYSIGRAAMVQKGESASCVPFFQRAVRLDPEFAVAYAALGNAYSNLGETGLAATNIRKAYELREHVSEHERLYIESHYYQFVTGDLTKAGQTYEVWAATYPNDEAPRTNLAVIYSDLGKLEQSEEQAKEAVRIAPDEGQTYANLVDAYITLNQLDKASATANEAIGRNLDTPTLRLYMYDLADLKHDTAGMQKLLDWASGEPGIEDAFLSNEGDEAARAGHLARARAFNERATDAARRADEKETAAGYQVDGAQREAIFGNTAEAVKLADSALSLAGDRDTRYGAAVTFALAGEMNRARPIAERLEREFPDDTIVQKIYLPTIRGAIAVVQKDPAGAIKSLEAAGPYDLGLAGGLLPVYVRGLAYLAQHDGDHAIAEFQKVLNYPGVVHNAPFSSLTDLELGRAWLLEGNREKAKDAYDRFLVAWKNADPEIPVLKQARSEYASQFAQHP
jgi:DNA-binding winged helix-turn-helix (wHTH) protein/tetratricopeptide (TPR) repeat protein